ncbi:efflux RND transporter periplasmic adaptor subunit [Rurimicrobium arvi]|uniref:Efflux RND transporter periplasmic adaptor subunit n=1 Tax=Rurimicrobium arvi TaxID=2049916 RepID=A0ABP8MTA9_9BACT
MKAFSNKAIKHTDTMFHHIRYRFLALALLIAGCHSGKEKVKVETSFVLSPKMLTSTTTATAGDLPLKNELNFYGKITADANKMIEIFPVVGGNVTKVYVELGDYVQKGQLLATIRSTEVAGFEKEMEDANNDVLVARNNLKVTQEMYEGKLNSERDVIEAKSQLEKANSQQQRIRETYQIYNIRKGATYEVHAPISGYVIQKNINEGMLLRSDKTDNIFDIADINDVWAIANVNESDINEVRLGIDASVTTLSYPDKIYTGKVDKIFNVIDPETKAMKVRIKLNNADNMLKPEMRATIKMSYSEDRSMIAIPSKAIVFDKSKYFVMIFKDRSNIETRQIEVYRQVGDTSYISGGLKEGEKVMTTNQLLVYDALND